MITKYRKPRIYDNECYNNFGEQPPILEIQIGYGLLPLIDKDNGGPLLKEIEYVRNEIDAEHGLPLPFIQIQEKMYLKSTEYKILLKGCEVGDWKKLNLESIFCIDTGSVSEEMSGEKTKEPAFDMDAILIAKERSNEAKKLGYLVVEPAVMIRIHLLQIIRQNITKFLDQSLVNNLINKVRKNNPDVVDNVFFMHEFSTSDLKIILNWLLEDSVSIRDMNTILETIADNLEETKNLVTLMEKIREKLAYSILQQYADENRIVHGILITKELSEFLYNNIYEPENRNELPKIFIDEIISKEISVAAESMSNKGFYPVFLSVSILRTAISSWLRLNYGMHCISDKEVYAAGKTFAISVDEKLNGKPVVS